MSGYERYTGRDALAIARCLDVPVRACTELGDDGDDGLVYRGHDPDDPRVLEMVALDPGLAYIDVAAVRVETQSREEEV